MFYSIKKIKVNKRKIFRWIKVIIIIYCSIGIALYYLQDYFLFHPKKLPADYVFKFDQPFKEMMIPINSTDCVNVVRFLPKENSRRGLLLYFHGNRENIEHYARYAKMFTAKGYEVWMPDYPGFGKTTGIRTEKKLYEQAFQVKRLAETKFHADSIIVYGKSFGTGIAAYVASVSQVKRLILETPYYSIPDLYSRFAFMYPTSYMVNYKIPTNEFFADIKAPVSIFHGTDDGVIPYRMASRLKSKLKTSDQFISIESGSHNDLPAFPLFNRSLDSLLQ